MFFNILTKVEFLLVVFIILVGAYGYHHTDYSQETNKNCSIAGLFIILCKGVRETWRASRPDEFRLVDHIDLEYMGAPSYEERKQRDEEMAE